MRKSGDSDACKWRHAHLEFLKKKLPQVSVKDEEGKLTYMQLLEMAKKDCGVSSPRERNLLNIMAFMHQPLTRSELVLEALTTLSLFYVRVLERMRIVLGSRRILLGSPAMLSGPQPDHRMVPAARGWCVSYDCSQVKAVGSERWQGVGCR